MPVHSFVAPPSLTKNQRADYKVLYRLRLAVLQYSLALPHGLMKQSVQKRLTWLP